MGKNAKLVFAACLFGAAGVIYWSMRSTPELPEGAQGETTHWYCVSCTAPFELPLDAPAEAFAAREIGRPQEGSAEPRPMGGRRGHGFVRVAKCPKCSVFEGFAAIRCGACGEIFREQTPSGKAMICPKCEWDPTTNQKAEYDRLDVLKEQ